MVQFFQWENCLPYLSKRLLHFNRTCTVPVIRFFQVGFFISVDTNYISWFIQTNGVLLSQEKIDFLKYNNVNIGISLDGVTDESNCSRKKINGQPSTKETISALNLLHKSGISTSILTVVNANNYSLILHELTFI